MAVLNFKVLHGYCRRLDSLVNRGRIELFSVTLRAKGAHVEKIARTILR